MSILKEIGLELAADQIIIENQYGCILKISDTDYFSIPAHSKHALEYALSSGRDYEYHVIEEHELKKKKGYEDGKTLHTLALESSVFNDRYTIETDFDQKYENYPFYFETLDSLRSFVSIHNKKVEQATKNVNELVKIFNEESKQENEQQNSKYTFDDIPEALRDSAISERTFNAFFKKHLVKTFTLIDLDSKCITKDIDSRFAYIQHHNPEWLNEYEIKANTPADTATNLNNLLMTKRKAIESLEFSEKIKHFKPSTYTTSADQKKALAQFLKDNGDAPKLISTSEPISIKIKKLLRNNVFVEKYPQSELQKIQQLSKDNSCEQVLESITAIYGKKALLKTLLEDNEKKLIKASNHESLSNRKYEHGLRIVDALYQHHEVNSKLSDPDNLYEVAVVWRDPVTNELMKGKLDVLNISKMYAMDLKFCSTVDYDKAARDCSQFNYHLQHAVYQEGIDYVLQDRGKLNNFFFPLCEKDADLGADSFKPIRVRMVEFEVPDIVRGLKLIRAALYYILQWKAVGKYPCFEGVDKISVPRYQRIKEERFLEQYEADIETSNRVSSQSAAIDSGDFEEQALNMFGDNETDEIDFSSLCSTDVPSNECMENQIPSEKLIAVLPNPSTIFEGV